MGDIAARKDIDRLISEINAAAERGHATLVTPKLRYFMNTQVSELAAEQERNRELTRQVEQLQARVDAAHALLEEFAGCETCGGFSAGYMRSEARRFLNAQALTAPPSSSDPGRAGTTE